ncbi:PLP-dependent transferase [Daldinia caldariorum]|uniref:PLP-dependent transferase n=1 Tax=Daldinia caldariorum TaxID=326644 RepID=UPI002008D839|nr:PLP-dependent transferase [Daldinia caldariorum]KAI1468319.1 PLP-dependent transferase [Daldinia caldariorum]
MLSTRAKGWTNFYYAHGKIDSYHATNNPTGPIHFMFAENWLMHDDLTEFINTHNKFDSRLCSYGEGYTGTVRLRTAMSKHLNTHFNPAQKVNPEEITFAAGVTALNEASALITCNPGNQEGLLLGRPVYGAFSRDLTMRTGAILEHVDVGDTEQFSPDCVAAYDAGFEAAKARGVNIRALVICNPHNPTGRCYPRETLVGLMRLCASKGIHLISDEIYALSTFRREDGPSEEFTSVLSIDTTGIIDPAQVHVLYGMSKDFGAAGMRLGCLISRNAEFTKAARAICCFSSPSQFSMDLAAKLLDDQEYLKKFLEKSRGLLRRNRLITEDLLTRAGVRFHEKGNAGLFMWLDLAPFLPLAETDGDGWEAEKLLSQRFKKVGITITTGAQYYAPKPGGFRLVYSYPEDTLREGIRRMLLVLKP